MSCRPAGPVPSHLRSWARGRLGAQVIFLNASLPRLGMASITLLSLERTSRIRKIFLKLIRNVHSLAVSSQKRVKGSVNQSSRTGGITLCEEVPRAQVSSCTSDPLPHTVFPSPRLIQACPLPERASRWPPNTADVSFGLECCFLLLSSPWSFGVAKHTPSWAAQ